MNVAEGWKNNAGYKFWIYAQLGVLISIFCYLFAENFVMSDSWEVLSLRSIDDYAMQDSLRSMQKAILSGDWKRVFGFFDYAYGNAYWLINAIILLPLYFIDNAQILIIAGRQISLIFVFLSIYVVSLIIDRIRPDAGSIKYAVLISIAAMPMVPIIATKYHVNAQVVFLGLLSFYILLRGSTLEYRSQVLSSLVAGLAVGFKLTSVIILPLLGLVLLTRLRQQGDKRLIKSILTYIVITIVTAAACTAPRILLFPFFIDELGATYRTFVLFKNMASTGGHQVSTLIVDGLGFYLSPFTLLFVFLLFIILAFNDLKNRSYITLYIFITIIVSITAVVIAVDKAPIYIATYLISLGFLLPLGFLGIVNLKFPSAVKVTIVYSIVITGLILGYDYRKQLFSVYTINFFEIAKSERVIRQIKALEEMRALVTPLKRPVRILQDSSSIFPATRFMEGVDVAINYGDLKEKSTWGRFDYILLNSRDYYGKRVSSSVRKEGFDISGLTGADLEEMTREILYKKGEYYGRKYSLIYEGYDALLYKLEE
ncbi:hypothetical protein [Sulfuriflexus mobilis]|uniref:hypothetical protein n=1 Tax=Sulfuriflexus mobilis TaxID=1811807 RepID=UPI000F8298B9|nr:hypothetical protein [Sulfuriflexus mobilis]